VKSTTLPSFWRAFNALTPAVQQQAREAYALFVQNPDHPSLRFKKLGGSKDRWSVKISEQYRAVGIRDGESIRWLWIGSHNEFDHLFN
jgi:hypothetical protein